MAASSTSSSLLKKFNTSIFINFRGKDIRRGFLPFLCEALKEKGIDPFTDEKLLEGEQITAAVEHAIRDSLISIVIFSENYAESPWCLDELVVIDDCRVNSNQSVLPIFYRVETGDVHELPPDGTFAKALQRLKETYPHRTDSLKEWSRVLKTISGDTKGWVATSNSKYIKDDWDLIKKISNRVWEILKDLWKKVVTTPSFSRIENKFVGMDWRVGKVISLLETEVNDRRAIGVWGMCGVGKTTLACTVFQQINHEFDGHYFVSKVKQIKEEKLSEVREQIKEEKLRNKIGAFRKSKIYTHLLDDTIKIRLRCKKALIVFDDVEDSNDVDSLVEDFNLFKEGSRIIVTSKDLKVLRNVCREEYIYQVEELKNSEDLQLFSKHAFHQNEPKQGFHKLSKKVIAHAKGNPLALRVLGSSLYGMEISNWESELERLKITQNKEIQQVLKVSYERLDREEQNIFLEIAFFNGEPENRVEMRLESFGFHAKSVIRRLVEKCLVNISEDGFVDMHNLLRHMGKEIVCEESKQRGWRSRLWSYKDIRHLLEANSGSDKIEGIANIDSTDRESCPITEPPKDEDGSGKTIYMALEGENGSGKTIYMVIRTRDHLRGFSYYAFTIEPKTLLEKNGDNNRVLNMKLFARLEANNKRSYDYMGCGAMGSKILLVGGIKRHEVSSCVREDFLELDTHNPKGKFRYGGRLEFRKLDPYCVEVDGTPYVVDGWPQCKTNMFEVYTPIPFHPLVRFLSVETRPELLYPHMSIFVFGSRIYVSNSDGIYYIDVNNIVWDGELLDYVGGRWEESEAWGTHVTLPFSGSSAFTFYFDSGDGYFFSFSQGQVYVNVMRDWVLKERSALFDVGKSNFFQACFASLGGGNYVVAASPPPCKQEELEVYIKDSIYVTTFNFKVSVGHRDHVKLDYKVDILSEFLINPNIFPRAKRRDHLDLKVIGCYAM